MKKFIAVAVLAGVCLGAAQAGVEVISEGTFFGSGTGADVVIQKQSGYVSDINVYANVATGATVVVHRGLAKTTATVGSALKDITVHTDSTNTVSGVTITASDYLIIGNQLCDVASLAPVAGGKTTVITVVANATVVKGDPVYIADAGDQVQFAIAADQTEPMPYVFTGFRDKPVAISVPVGAGATLVSGRYEVKR